MGIRTFSPVPSPLSPHRLSLSWCPYFSPDLPRANRRLNIMCTYTPGRTNLSQESAQGINHPDPNQLPKRAGFPPCGFYARTGEKKRSNKERDFCFVVLSCRDRVADVGKGGLPLCSLCTCELFSSRWFVGKVFIFSGSTRREV